MTGGSATGLVKLVGWGIPSGLGREETLVLVVVVLVQTLAGAGIDDEAKLGGFNFDTKFWLLLFNKVNFDALAVLGVALGTVGDFVWVVLIGDFLFSFKEDEEDVEVDDEELVELSRFKFTLFEVLVTLLLVNFVDKVVGLWIELGLLFGELTDVDLETKP